MIAENIESYKAPFHAHPNEDEGGKPNATCNDCHNVHSFNVPPRGSAERTEWHRGISALCGTCHEDALDTWTESVHGREVTQKHNPKAAVCTDCHTSHDIKGSKSSDAHGLAQFVGQQLEYREIGETLAQVDRPVFRRQLRHHRENGRAGLGKLGVDLHGTGGYRRASVDYADSRPGVR